MSGTRNFKRLGAPGHYVNVRFDDAHVRLCRNGRGGLHQVLVDPDQADAGGAEQKRGHLHLDQT